ncbi:NOL1 [Auxenochlorella protothecoides x Auxenochlorella symbiontica]|uniref:Chlorophyll(Ide) b reductase NOL, chloroplastic n=1 Tax=Auxenochlorella protothecoides TaxID=3075 RepID=A0A1D2AGA3_AUXPR
MPSPMRSLNCGASSTHRILIAPASFAHAGRPSRTPLRPTSSLIKPPFNVVITGGTKGVGKALASEFLAAGDSVALCARSAEAVDATVEELRSKGRVVGRACDVARAADVEAFTSFAQQELGRVDMWINNAGTNAYRFGALEDQPPEDLEAILTTNVLGAMLGCRAAMSVMAGQPSGGHIFLVDGAGADGGATPRFAAYGASKRALSQLGKSLNAELRGSPRRGRITVHTMSPGMVTTELLMAGADTRVARFFINVLAETPETVAANLVPRLRQVVEGSRGVLGSRPQYIRYLTKPKAYGQILMRLLAKQRKNKFVEEE